MESDGVDDLSLPHKVQIKNSPFYRAAWSSNILAGDESHASNPLIIDFVLSARRLEQLGFIYYALPYFGDDLAKWCVRSNNHIRLLSLAKSFPLLPPGIEERK